MLVTSVISVKFTIYKIHALSENYLSVCLSIYICIYLSLLYKASLQICKIYGFNKVYKKFK